MDEFAYHGEWHVPATPEKTVHGTLTFRPSEGITLEIREHSEFVERLGPFPDDDARSIPPGSKVVFGDTDAGPITLYHLLPYHLPHGFHTRYSYHPYLMFRGILVENVRDQLFKYIFVTYSNLNEWVSGANFTSTHLADKRQAQFTYQFPDNITLFRDQKFSVELAQRFAGTWSDSQIDLKDVAEIWITANVPSTFEDFEKVIHNVRNFLCFAMSETVDAPQLAGMPAGMEAPFGIDIYYNREILKNPAVKVRNWDMLFSFAKMQELAPEALENWIKNAEEFLKVHDLYSAHRYNKSLYLESYYLLMMQALETYHRLAYPNQVYEPNSQYLGDLYLTLKGSIPSGINPAFRDSLGTRLRFANQYSLRRRIVELLKDVAAILPDDFPKSKAEIAKFSERAKDIRNYYTHYDDQIFQSNPPSPSEVLTYAEQVEIILEACFLRRVGFSDEKAKELLALRKRGKFWD